MYKIVSILRTVILAGAFFTLPFSSQAQSDTLEIRKAPVLSQLPIIFDRNEISDELSRIQKPVFRARPVVVSEVRKESRFGSQPALKLIIPEVDQETVNRNLSRFMRREGDGKLEREGNTLYMEDIQIDEVSSDYFNAEVWLDKDSTGLAITMAMMTDSTVITPESHKTLFDAMEDLLESKGREYYRDKVTRDLQEERKKLDDMEKSLSSLVKDSEKSHKNISDNNISINQSNIEIDQNEIELKAISQELVQKRSLVASARDKESRKAAKKAESSTEKSRKRLQKDREKLFQSIIDSKREIQESEQDIRVNLESQKKLLIDMHRQTLVIEAMKDKLESI